MAFDNVEVKAVTELGRQATALAQTTAEFEAIAGRARSTANQAVAECATAVARRTQELANCEAQEDADCSGCRQRLQTALDVQRAVQRAASELSQRLSNLSRRLDADTGAGVAWMRRMLGGLDAVGSTGSAGLQGNVSGGGTGGELGVVAAGPVESGVRAGGSPGASASGSASLSFGNGLSRLPLARLHLDPDLFEKEPPDGVTKEDMIWAAQTFKDVVLPHAARGGTQDELTAIDSENGHFVGLRRLSGVWDTYLGADATTVDMDGTGNVTHIHGGRHRALAAQIVGLTWVPGRVNPGH